MHVIGVGVGLFVRDNLFLIVLISWSSYVHDRGSVSVACSRHLGFMRHPLLSFLREVASMMHEWCQFINTQFNLGSRVPDAF